MQPRHILSAAMVILALSFHYSNPIYAHGPGNRSGQSANRGVLPATALAAQLAAQNPRLTPQQAALLANQQLAAFAAQLTSQYPGLSPQQATFLADSRVSSFSTLSGQLAAQLIAQNPRLTPQQASIQAGQELSGLVSQIAAQYPQTSASAYATLSTQLAAQIAAQNPRLTAQQATYLAGQEISAFLGQGTTTPISAAQAALSGLPVVTPGFGGSGFIGNGTGSPGFIGSGTGPFQPAVPSADVGGGDIAGTPQTAAGAELQGTAAVIAATGKSDLASSAAAVNLTQAESNALRNRVQAVQTFWDVRNLGRAEREKDRRWPPSKASSEEEVAQKKTRTAAPFSLNANQMDPATGALNWPGHCRMPPTPYNAALSKNSRPNGRSTASWTLPIRDRCARTSSHCPIV